MNPAQFVMASLASVIATMIIIVLFLLAIFLAKKIWERGGGCQDPEAPTPDGSDPVSELDLPFRVRFSPDGPYYSIGLVSVHDGVIRVSTGQKSRSYITGVVTLDQVHPEDRPRVERSILAHPTATDRYEFED